MTKRRDVFIFSAVNDNEDAVILLSDDRRDIDIYREIARDEVTEINVIDVEDFFILFTLLILWKGRKIGFLEAFNERPIEIKAMSHRHILT